MNILKLELALLLTLAFGFGLLGGIILMEYETTADLIELDQWRAAHAYQQMQEPPKLPKWCEIIEKGNYGYNWPKP